MAYYSLVAVGEGGGSVVAGWVFVGTAVDVGELVGVGVDVGVSVGI